MLSKNKNLIPYQFLLFGALGLYLWKMSKENQMSGIDDGTRVNIDTDKLSRAAMPFVPVPPQYEEVVKTGIKKTLDSVLAGVKK